MVWFRCSRGSLAYTTWILKTLAHALDWLGTSSATVRLLCEFVTPWPMTWRTLPPSALLTLSKAHEPGRSQTPTLACSRSPLGAQRIRAYCSSHLARIRVTTQPPTPLHQTGSASAHKREAQTRVFLFKPMVPIPRAHRRLIFSEPFR